MVAIVAVVMLGSVGCSLFGTHLTPSAATKICTRFADDRGRTVFASTPVNIGELKASGQRLALPFDKMSGSSWVALCSLDLRKPGTVGKIPLPNEFLVTRDVRRFSPFRPVFPKGCCRA